MNGVGENSVVSVKEEDDEEGKGSGTRKLDDGTELNGATARLAGEPWQDSRGIIGQGKRVQEESCSPCVG